MTGKTLTLLQTPRIAEQEFRTLKWGNFDQTFLKVCAVEAAEASSPSADGEIFYTAFLFVNFFFAPPVCKEKVAMGFEHVKTLIAFFPKTAKNLLKAYRVLAV